MSLRKDILDFDEAFKSFYNFTTDSKISRIHFSLCLATLVHHINMGIKEYLDDMGNGECKEVLGIDFKRLTRKEHWLKNEKLKNIKTSLDDTLLEDYGIIFQINGQDIKSPASIIQFIEDGVIEMTALLKEAKKKTMSAPIGLFGNFYHKMNSREDDEPVMTEYEEWKMSVGKLTFDRLKEKQTQTVADFLKRDVFRYASQPTKREMGQVRIDAVCDYLPCDFSLPTDFDKQCAKFRRFISWKDDVLHLDYDIYGKYLFQYYYMLSDDERIAMIGLDKWLSLIHQDMVKLRPELAKCLKQASDSRAEYNYFAIEKNLKVLLEGDWFRQARTDKNYDQTWTDQFVTALMKSEHGDEIAKEWQKAERRVMLKCAILGAMKDAGILKGSYRAIAQLMSDKCEQAETLSKYMGYGKKQPFYGWILANVNH